MGCLLLGFAVFLVSTVASAGNLTYNLTDYPVNESGYSLSGQIITDGMVGTLSGSDILSWSFTASNGQIGQGQGSEYGLAATPTQLLVPLDTEFRLVVPSGSYSGGLTWENYGNSSNSWYNFSYYYYYDSGQAVYPWSTYNPQMGGTQPWVIAQTATIPEPSTFVLLAVGLIALISRRYLRRIGLLVAIALSVSLCSIGHAQDITYNLMDYPADENGYSLSGFITTDGTIGILTTYDIQTFGFNMYASNGSLVCSETGTGEAVFRGGSGFGATILDATSTQLLLPSNYSLTLSGGNSEYLGWANNYPAQSLYFGGGSYWFNTNPQMNGEQPWVIAQTAPVPEPSTFVLALAGAIALLGFCWGWFGVRVGLGSRRR